MGFYTQNDVTSVFGRSGAVIASSGDYSAAQVTNAAATNVANTFSAIQTVNASLLASSVGTATVTGTASNLTMQVMSGSGNNNFQIIDDNGNVRLVVGRNDEIIMSSNFRFSSDGVDSIGRQSDSRPSAIYAARAIQIGYGNGEDSNVSGSPLLVDNRSGAVTDICAVIKSRDSQTADFLQLQSWNGSQQPGVVQFGIDINGGVKTNQTSTGTVLGSVIKKMPIYNVSGTLIGYIPIYDSIT